MGGGKGEEQSANVWSGIATLPDLALLHDPCAVIVLATTVCAAGMDGAARTVRASRCAEHLGTNRDVPRSAAYQCTTIRIVPSQGAKIPTTCTVYRGVPGYLYLYKKYRVQW